MCDQKKQLVSDYVPTLKMKRWGEKEMLEYEENKE